MLCFCFPVFFRCVAWNVTHFTLFDHKVSCIRTLTLFSSKLSLFICLFAMGDIKRVCLTTYVPQGKLKWGLMCGCSRWFSSAWSQQESPAFSISSFSKFLSQYQGHMTEIKTTKIGNKEKQSNLLLPTIKQYKEKSLLTVLNSVQGIRTTSQPADWVTQKSFLMLLWKFTFSCYVTYFLVQNLYYLV